MWFLTCLYHDVGYGYEKDDGKGKAALENKLDQKGLEGLKEFLSLGYVCDDVYKTYQKEMVNLYFKSRLKGREKLDHGIVGGLLLYDRLRKRFEEAWE